jgi:hypothetical protein
MRANNEFSTTEVGESLRKEGADSNGLVNDDEEAKNRKRKEWRNEYNAQK